MGIKSWLINRLEKDVEPDIYYHETMYPSRKPFAFDLKKRLLSYLRGTKQIEEAKTVNSTQEINKNSWELSDEERNFINAKEKNLEIYDEAKSNNIDTDIER